MKSFSSHPYRIVLHTTDLGVLHCMRSLAYYCEEFGNKRSAHAETATERKWREADFHAVFQFTATSCREKFLEEMKRLIDGSLWRLVALEELVARSSDDSTNRGSHETVSSG